MFISQITLINYIYYYYYYYYRLEFMEQLPQSVNQRHKETIQKLRRIVKSKHHGMLYNSRQHTSDSVEEYDSNIWLGNDSKTSLQLRSHHIRFRHFVEERDF